MSVNVELRVFPEISAGGFSRKDQQVLFHTRVRALLKQGDIVLDLGAGRAEWKETETVATKLQLLDLTSTGATVLGADVDGAIGKNEYIAGGVQIGHSGQMPFGDESIDMVYCRSVFEHVENVVQFSAEISRVLRPGGWLVALTPNKHGSVALANRLLSGPMAKRVLSRLQPDRHDYDIFPAHYRLNTISQLKEHFPTQEFSHFTFPFGEVPRYFGSHVTLARLLQTYEYLAPSPLRSHLHVFIQKSPSVEIDLTLNALESDRATPPMRFI